LSSFKRSSADGCALADPTPIKQGIEPEFDTERELVDFATIQIRRFCTDVGVAPQSIAIVLIGENDEGNCYTKVNSWSPDNSKSQFETCSMGAALLTNRAIKGD
jgi:hypothetical protein